MVKPKGWDGVRPYWWCDTPLMHAVADHIRTYLPHPHPYFGIYVQGTEKFKPESIIINRMHSVELLNINSKTSNTDQLLEWISNLRLIMDDAIIEGAHFTFNKEEHFKNKHTYNLQYTWQQLENESKHSDR